MAFRRDRLFHVDDALAASRQALALSLETGNLQDIARCNFQLGSSHLWSDQLDEAEAYLRRAQDISERNGDLIQLTRALNFLAILYRKRGDIEGVRDLTNDVMQVMTEAHLPQYLGMAHAEYAWLAWRAGDTAETLQQVDKAMNAWQAIARVVAFMWLALFPGMGVALQQHDIEKAVTLSRQLIHPWQQRLPDDLTQLLERTITAWEQNLPEAASDLLRQAFQCAQSSGYV
jgi:tetratricopeptide (TPR) repeat protein